MLGYKVYYEKTNGDVILTIPEKHNSNAVPTSKEQDFALFDVLQVRNPETVDFIQLPYGQLRGDFEIANSWKVDVGTKQILFAYPVFEKPIAEQVYQLRKENDQLKLENEALKQSQADQDEVIMQLMLGGM